MPRKKKGRTVEEAERLVAGARNETDACVEVLVDLRDKAKSPNVRLNAARLLLEYGWGKPAMMENVEDPATKLNDKELEVEFQRIQDGKSSLPKAKKET